MPSPSAASLSSTLRFPGPVQNWSVVGSQLTLISPAAAAPLGGALPSPPRPLAAAPATAEAPASPPVACTTKVGCRRKAMECMELITDLSVAATGALQRARSERARTPLKAPRSPLCRLFGSRGHAPAEPHQGLSDPACRLLQRLGAYPVPGETGIPLKALLSGAATSAAPGSVPRDPSMQAAHQPKP